MKKQLLTCILSLIILAVIITSATLIIQAESPAPIIVDDLTAVGLPAPYGGQTAEDYLDEQDFWFISLKEPDCFFYVDYMAWFETESAWTEIPEVEPEPATTFVAGKTYVLFIPVEIDAPGYEFDDELTVNNACADSVVVSQYNEYCYSIPFNYTAQEFDESKAITNLDITIPTTAGTPVGALYTAKGEHYTAYALYWTEDLVEEVPDSVAFYISVMIDTEDGYFVDLSKTEITLNGKPANIIGGNVSMSGCSLQVVFFYSPYNLSTIEVGGLPAFVEGVSAEDYIDYVELYAFSWCEIYLEDDYAIFEGVVTDSAGIGAPFTGTFVAGQQYTLALVVSEDGIGFLPECDVKAFGADSTAYEYIDAKTAILYLTFTAK